MPQEEEKHAAAVAAAQFDLMLLMAYNKEQRGPIATDLYEVLSTTELAGQAQAMIEKLADDSKTLKGSAVDLARKNRIACIALGEIFAIALEKADASYLKTIVPMEEKNSDIANTLYQMNATTLAKCFDRVLN